MKNSITEKMQSLRTGWYIWLFPVFALMISGWLFVDYFKQRGVTIKIFFDDASGIQAEKTKVRFRGVPIGMVKNVYISEENKDVVVEVSLRKDAEQFAVIGSKFELVVPKVDFSGISGLNTLFEGTYIAALPGPFEGKEKFEFKAQSATGSTDTHDDTSSYILETTNAESVSAGDLITFRGMKVGTVTKLILAKGSQAVHVQINIENKYVKLIRTNTVFWRKIGVQAKLGLFGSSLKISSMDSLLHGGIDFFTPDNAGEIAKPQAHFPLVASPPKDWEKWNPKLDF